MARAQAQYQLAALRGPQGLEAPLSGNCLDTSTRRCSSNLTTRNVGTKSDAPPSRYPCIRRSVDVHLRRKESPCRL